MTKTDIWIPIYIGDYLSDTMHLTTRQHGAYFLIIMAYWKNNGPLPANGIKTIAKLSNQEWAEDGSVVSDLFNTTIIPNRWVHKRIDREMKLALSNKSKKSKSGKLGAISKWGDSISDNNIKRSERLTTAREKGTHTKAEWLALKSIFSCCPRCEGNGEPVKDHIIPIYQGGSDSIDNIQPLCRKCNSQKGAESEDYRPSNWSERLAECLAK